ncbi:helix-turn-helix domain-containing protein [Vibrio sp. CB1-14]|uniref:Helix-turn-helix domain-containing protein n=1 Tax=Vibrio chaetopteri TaxID=3016528 RepID=A0AAU8BDW0_9VIBR
MLNFFDGKYEPFQPFLTYEVLESCGVILEQHQPSELLSGVVHSYLQVTTTKPIRYSVVPDGMEAFYVSSCGVLISGFQENAFDLNLSKPGQYFGIRFHPGGLQCFFDIASNLISSKIMDAVLVFNDGEKLDFHNQLYQYPDFNTRIKFCDEWLLQKLKPSQSSKFDSILLEIYKTCGNIAVGELADKVGLSSRHLNRIVQSYTGLSTKSFIQIIRIQFACKIAWREDSSNSELALDLGYFDQSHLLNDYRKRIRTNPTGLFSRLTSDFYNKSDE